jgi:hypothetical protein
MASGDLALAVAFHDAQGHEAKGALRLSTAAGQTTLSFHKDLTPELLRSRRDPRPPDAARAISDDDGLHIDPQNPLLVHLIGKPGDAALVGARSPRIRFTFGSLRDLSRFMEYLVQKMRVIRSEASGDLYLLRPLVRSQAAFSAAQPGGARKPHERIELALWEGLTHRQDFSPVFISTDSLNPELFYNADFDPAVVFEAFRILLRPESAPEVSYGDVKQQWTSLSERQFLNQPDLRKTIRDLEANIKAKAVKFEKFKNPAWAKSLVFEVLLTYSLYNWDGTRSLEESTVSAHKKLDEVSIQAGPASHKRNPLFPKES